MSCNRDPEYWPGPRLGSRARGVHDGCSWFQLAPLAALLLLAGAPGGAFAQQGAPARPDMPHAGGTMGQGMPMMGHGMGGMMGRGMGGADSAADPAMPMMGGMGGMVGHGMMGQRLPGMLSGNARIRVLPSFELQASDVERHLTRALEWLANPRLKLGVVTVEGEVIFADIVTVDGSLVQRLRIDRATGIGTAAADAP
ncbi:MAG: hypothetical protein EXQ96_00790 [Alphaproteobacteria bacterium]|nr:hypothetical protein [Alphaproteobacteria bacterium]